ncbi:uncharacterized protein LOC122869929 isoform X2 [Siniperca chuatsi]|uniref:uncharacterized protein LOC122869929 isoform X2 n=1 Tax=Siniperca chuatsi TaxID=119488 RepID=UPI001CE10F63|nr:uncharacterized protein LOC122869929 isoform X2 [Siniperca chuatsi]
MSYLEKCRQFLDNAFSPPANKYHGLLNQGATCYLNSVLQVLFMTEGFREAVERHTCDNPDTECIDHQLKTLFDDLRRHTAYTYNITNKLSIDRVYEQRDAAEYFEKILNLTSPKASQIFHGQLTHKTICSACCTEMDTNGAFWHLPLALVDSFSEEYSVVNGIEEYFRASDFSGENQMYCDQCDAKSDATIKCVIKHHPEVLMLLLKRFEFDYRYMTYVKINCTVDVPCTLQIPENQTYELYAVVEHFGDLRSGHYVATIKDDERWYSFNDDTVTLLNYQPFQVDNFEKSSSAYLLFYRKAEVHAADRCTQDIREVSPPGDFPLATSDIYNQCQDAGTMREREEAEGAAEAGNDTTVAVSIDKNEEIGTKDRTVSVGSRGLGLSPDSCVNVVYTRQSIPYSEYECNEDRNDLRNAEAHDKSEKRETLSRETQLQESIKDQDNDSGRLNDVRQRRPQEVSNMPAIHDYPEQVCVDMQRDEEGMAMDGNGDMDGKMAGDEQSERRGKASTKYLHRDAEHQDNERLDDVRQNMNENQEGKQKIGQDYDLKPVSVDKQGDGEMMEIDVKADNEEKTGGDERGMASGRVNLKNDLSCDESQDKGNGRVGDSKHNMPKDDQRCQQGSSSNYERHEGTMEGRHDSKQSRKCHGKIIEEEIKETSSGTQRTIETKNISIETVEGTSQDGRSWVDNVRQNMNENQEGKQKIGQDYDLKPVSVDKQGDGEMMEIDVKADNEEKTGGDERGMASGRVNLKNDLSCDESQDKGNGKVGDSKHNMPKDDQRCQQGSSSNYERHEGTMEGRHGSKQSRKCHGKIIEEEIKETSSGTQRTIETKNISIETVEGTSQDGRSWVENNKRNDPKTDAKVSLPKGFQDLTLSGSPLQEAQKRRTKRVIGNKTNSTIYLNAIKKQNVSDAQEQAAAIKLASKKKTRAHKKKRKFHSSQKKSTGCFCWFRKSRKNADQTSESD